MHYVIIRDDDTNAFTPVECLERLYRPFLDRGLPVNLAVIPDVSTEARMPNGQPEGFLAAARYQYALPAGVAGRAQPGAEVAAALTADRHSAQTRPIGSNEELVSYLHENQGFKIVQHGCHHEHAEFDRTDRRDIVARLERGARLLREAGFPAPHTFVAPHDKLSRISLGEVQKRFRVLSTGWFELRRLPYAWWPRYFFKKLRQAQHWQVRGTILLSHPGCLLSCHRTYSTMMGGILHHLKTNRLTVLVTHWWEYFRDGVPDEPFIDFLHETASHLATCPETQVISFEHLASGSVALR
ncbi:MAG TPA: DUF2334 domain-containing protein [Verrucomicrobiae bacterium]|nr:DUF2334 domain-containing protein [Verrucomicrobiae bacterium]